MPAIGVRRALEASPPGRRVALSWCQVQFGSRGGRFTLRDGLDAGRMSFDEGPGYP
jgi:hypothetical protein